MIQLPTFDAGAVRLRVRVIRGSMPAARYRLRRSNTTSSDPLRMLAVASVLDGRLARQRLRARGWTDGARGRAGVRATPPDRAAADDWR